MTPSNDQEIELHFTAVSEPLLGRRWHQWFLALWPAYRKWFLSEGEGRRASYLRCESALRRAMPELVPTWEQAAELAGGGDLQARFLSLYCPPPYLSGCSQAIWLRDEPVLVRNYDYVPRLLDGLILRSEWNGRVVIAVTDCLIGVLDGMNRQGLTVSLSFGGNQTVGRGFGAPMVLRYLLEFSTTVSEAIRVLRRMPTHMAYNILVCDRNGDFVTAFTAPEGPTILRRTPVSTNHQDRIAWPQHAQATATLERERKLFSLLDDPSQSEESFIDAFVAPPLRSTKYNRGFGTLYTVAYWPTRGEVEFLWENKRWRHSLDGFQDGEVRVRLQGASADRP